MNAAPRRSLWKVPAPGRVVWREWGDEYVVYNGSNTTTHLLSAFAGILLVTLLGASQPLSGEALLKNALGDNALGEKLDAGEDVAEAVEATLLEFERLGLARQYSS